MATLKVIEKNTSLNVINRETKLNISSIGIQGAKGDAGYPLPLQANQLLTNDGNEVKWTNAIDEIDMNGGYF